MVKELKDLLPNFPGPANQTRCFTHILNLVVKSILRQFDVPKMKVGEVLDEALRELANIAGNIELEEAEDRQGNGAENDSEEDDNIEGWIDKRELLTEEEKIELDEAVRPVRLVLTKVFFFSG
jgi:hypothetical protein